MKRVILVAALALSQCWPCEAQQPLVVQERPVVNIPLGLRQENWLGKQGEGSCVWASTVSLLRWQGRYNAADWVRENCGDGQSVGSHVYQMEKIGLRYAFITNGNVKFLEWCCRTRRGAGVVVMGGVHMVNLVHLDSQWACILDNNNVSRYYWVPREKFLSEWRTSGGLAFTVVYSPAAPMPR